MPLNNLKIPPGVNNLNTALGSEGRWNDADKVRFFKGQPQKIGGWQKKNTNTFLGKCRRMRDWVSFGGLKWLALGTHLKLYVYGTGFSDITPLRETQALTNPFDTTNLSAVVTVNDTAHGAVNNDFVTISGSAAVGGITPSGNYQITYVDPNSYTITHSSAATSSVTGGGGASVVAKYEITVGSDNGFFGLGWGAGTWGASTWGSARAVSNIFLFPRTWSLTMWGEDLIANPRGGGIYTWDTSVGTGTRATVISGAPSTASFVLVTPESRHLVAYGAHDGVADNKLNIRWCAREDYTAWTPSAINTAGDKLLDSGSDIIAALPTSREILIYTDVSVYSQQFIGGNEVFSFRQLGDVCGLRAPGAAVQFADIVYWMGVENFFLYDGQLRVIPCEVHDHVFNNINESQRGKIIAGINRDYTEVWWFYPRGAATENSHYVVYNFVDQTWTIGSLARTAWIDRGEVVAAPNAAGADGYLYEHETGTDDASSAMEVYVETGDFDLLDGDQFAYMDRIIPDFKNLTGTADITIKFRDYPQSTQRSKGPFAYTTDTTKIDFRGRGRQVALRVGSSSVGDHWRYGTMRARLKTDGLG
jgi:hypothetical protein